jgi:glycine/D-amino acid oxidase-like deaminating enzyme
LGPEGKVRSRQLIITLSLTKQNRNLSQTLSHKEYHLNFFHNLTQHPTQGKHTRTMISFGGIIHRIYFFCFCLVLCSTYHSVVVVVNAMATTTPHTAPKNIVVIGGGIQGASVAYHIAQKIPPASKAETTITILESKAPASAASGKGGGFMARSWGDGSPTQRLHELAFDMYVDLAQKLDCKSYRQLPVLSVTPGYSGVKQAQKDKRLGPIMPSWLDGNNVGRISVMGYGEGDTAQITPSEFVMKMLEATNDKGVTVKLGTCTGIETDQGSERGTRKVTGVKYTPRVMVSDNNDNDDDDNNNIKDEVYIEEQILPADAVIVSAGPWSCAAEDWFHGAVQLPMEGIKSTSIVWKKPDGVDDVDATALFCGEHDKYHTHLEVYPRPDGTIYLCGIGGSDYISKDELKNGAFREVCDAKEQRVEAAMQSFQEMSSLYQRVGKLDRTQACMRPCPPDAMPYMGSVPGFEGAYINAGHNCWGIAWGKLCSRVVIYISLMC